MSSQIGIDLVDLTRFEKSLNRTPGLIQRLFTDQEFEQGSGRNLALHLAGRFAAKEALAKALGVPPGLSWHEVEVLRLESGGGMVHSYGLASSQLVRIRDAGIPLTVCVDLQVVYTATGRQGVQRLYGKAYRDGAIALGSRENEVVRKVVLPAAFGGILTGGIVGCVVGGHR